jgi:hypothetical protein
VQRATYARDLERCRRSAKVYLEGVVTMKSHAVNNQRSVIDATVGGHAAAKEDLAYLVDNLREVTEWAEKRGGGPKAKAKAKAKAGGSRDTSGKSCWS